MPSDAEPQLPGRSTLSTLTTGLASTFAEATDDPSSWISVGSTATEASTIEDLPFSTTDTLAFAVAGCPLISTTTGSDLHSSDLTEPWTKSDLPISASRLSGVSPGSDFVPGFHIEAELGRGGMGIVYKAWQIELKRVVALKMIRDDRLGNAQSITRFAVEAEALARIDHPNIVKIFQIGKSHGAPFVTLEWLEGGTLACRAAGTPQSFHEAASLLSTVADAVHAAHVAGILHRDLKPSNILFSRDGTPKITDFGLAKRIEEEEGETQSGQVIGTPSYMAPEQARGWTAGLGRAVDIYSLGAILYELLTGRPPHKGANPAETRQLVLSEEPLPPSRLRPKIPFDLETICLKCLERDPRKRYFDANALARDLQRFLDGQPIRARRTPFWERAWKQSKRRPITTLFLAFGLAAAVFSLGYLRHTQALERHANESRNRHVSRLRDATFARLLKLQKLWDTRQWDEVRAQSGRLVNTLQDEPLLADLRLRASELYDHAERALQSEKRLQTEKNARDAAATRCRKFLDSRDETLFIEANFTGVDPARESAATIRSARAGLSIFGIADQGDDWTLPTLPTHLSDQEKTAIARGFHELLLILADALANAPATEDAVGQQAESALRLLDRAALVQPSPTRASRLQRADYWTLRGRNEAARHERERAGEMKPVDPADLFLTARWYARHGEWTTATPLLEEAARREPDHFWSNFQLAIAHVQTRQPSKAQLCLNTCLQQKPDCVWVFLFRGLAATGTALENRRLGAIPEANAMLQSAEADHKTALSLIGERPEKLDLRYVLLFHRGITRLELNALDAAGEDLRAAIGLDEHRGEAHQGLGKVLARQGRRAEAAAQFSRAIECLPTRGDLYRDRARLVFDDPAATPDHCRAAAADLEEALRREPSDKKIRAEDRARQAVLWRRAGRANDALQASTAALRDDPTLMLAHQTRVLCLFEAKRYDMLLESCTAALQQLPPTAQLHELSGLARAAANDHAGAVTDYTCALRLRPDDSELLCRRGWSLLAVQSYIQAFHDFDAALRVDDKRVEAYNGRALASIERRKFPDAVKDAESAVAADRKDWLVSYRAAAVYALAAHHALPENRTPGKAEVERMLKFQDRSIELIQHTLRRMVPAQREGFLRETLQTDPAFRPLAKRLRPLLVEFPKAG